MPNWCNNNLTFVGSKEVLDKVLDFVKPKSDTDGIARSSDLSLDSIYPMPAEMKQGDGWYNWCINNWGTKWDVDAYIKDRYDYEGYNYVIISFDSAWGPPQNAILHLSETFPEIGIHHSYDECGMDFSGYDVYFNGERQHYVEYGFSVSNAVSSMDGSHYFEWDGVDFLKENK